ncbi:hypothetical protein PV08_05697 [Exophiala spinifera]|uniref:DUF726-domain-containing protein n=1 Tax=Exophiala spinifera TaxID=91928 RepID=A0A0D2B9L3_9EURO|nr:uncharacterized protein PV08_05697 [Exophiala spinifera]KIW15648.1 hypothetical protein PV08_05697 [Exophiala spinifera]
MPEHQIKQRHGQSSNDRPRGDGDDDGQDGLDLTTILNENQRADLTLLVANLAESMRKLIQDNFDSTAGLNRALLREGMSEDEKMMAADPHADVSSYDRERRLKDEADRDLATDRMKALKSDALKCFDEWREQVIMRVGEAVNTSPSSSKVKKNKKTQPTAATAADAGKTPEREGSLSATATATPRVPVDVVKGQVAVGPRSDRAAALLKFKDLYPGAKTPLTKMTMKERTLILHSVLLLLISLEHYNAFSRVLMLNLTRSLKLPLKTFEQDEYTTARGLLEHAREMEMETSADEAMRAKIEANRHARRKKVAIAAAAGAAILGVSGGLAAPLVAAGVGSVMGGLGLGATSAAAYLGSVAGSTVLVGGLFGAYGGRMTGQMMDQYAREVEDFRFLPVHGRYDDNDHDGEMQRDGDGKNNSKGGKTKKCEDVEQAAHDHKLRVTIGVSGWLTEKEEVVKPWRVLGVGSEVFALKWELEALLNLGNAMNGVVQSAAWGYAQKEVVKRTIFADLAGAMWPVALMKVARVIDNPFSVAKSRADKAGEVLADALVRRAQGERPVTLVGYSLGARVVYTCLTSLARRGAFEIVENAVLIGSPTPSDTSDWRVLRSAVAGRLVNVFSVNDYVLGFMYRTSAVQYGVAGLQKVEALSGVENFDVSEDVSSHQRYRYLIGAILKKIGFEDVDMDAVDREKEALVEMEKREKKESLENQRRWMIRRESRGGNEDQEAEGEAEASELEKMVRDQTKKSLVTRAIEYFYLPQVPNADDVKKITGSVQGMTNDPSSAAGEATDQTMKTSQGSVEPLTTRLYRSLPSMPYASTSTTAGTAAPQNSPIDTKKTTDKVGKTGKGTVDQGQGYISQASSYLSSLRAGRGTQKDATGQGENATTTASDVANTTASAAKGATGTLSDTVTTTVKNTLNPKDNPAVKSSRRAAREAPIIHQANDRTPQPIKDKAGDVSDIVGTTAQNTGQTLQKGVDTGTSKATDGGKNAVSHAQEAAKTTGQLTQKGMDTVTSTGGKIASSATSQAQDTPQASQTYTSRAASYLPGLPRLGFGSGGEKKAPPKLEKRASSSRNVTENSPKLDKKKPSKAAEKPSPPKLDGLPSAKLERTPSGLKSPPAKVERVSSGVRSPPADKLERVSSVVKTPSASAPTPKVDKESVGQLRMKPPKLGPRRTSQQQQQSGAKSPSAGVGEQGVPSAESIHTKLSKLPSGSVDKATGAGKSATSNAAQAAQKTVGAGKSVSGKAEDAAKGVGTTAAQAAGKTSEVAQGAAQQGGGNVLSSAGKFVGLRR